MNLFNLIVHSIQVHPVYWAVGAGYIFSTVVSCLPSPDANSGKGYNFFFAVTHAFAAGIPRIIVTMFPAIAAKLPFLTNGNGNGSQLQP